MDAKIVCMIHDLFRGTLADLLGIPPDEEYGHHFLMCEVLKGYEGGHILAEDIIAAWDEDQRQIAADDDEQSYDYFNRYIAGDR